MKGKKNAAMEFSNANVEDGLGLSGDLEGNDSDKSTADSDDDDDQECSSGSSSSSDSITDDTDSDIRAGGDDGDHDDVIKGLSIIGTGYRMSGTWSPGHTLSNTHNEISKTGLSAYNNSSVIKLVSIHV